MTGLAETEKLTSTRGARWVLIAIGGLVGGAVPLILASSGREIAAAVLLLLLGSLGLIHRALARPLSGRSSLDFFSPFIFFPLLYGFLYGLGSLVYVQSLDITIATQEYALYFAGLLTYYAGASFTSRLVSAPGPRCVWNSARFRLAILGLFLASSAAFAYLVSRSGFFVLSSDVEVAQTSGVERVGGYLMYLVDSLEIVIYLLLAYAFVHSSRRNRPRLSWLALFSLAVLALVSLAARRKIARPLLAALILFNYARTRIRFRHLVPLAAAGALGVVLAGTLRYQGALQVNRDLFMRTMQIEVMREAAALHELSQVIPSQFDFFRWRGALLPFIALAPGTQKPLSYILKEDVLNRTFRGGGYVPGILGWWYVNFGAVGAVIGMLLLGLLLGALYERLRQRRDLFSKMLYSYVAAFSFNFLRSGFLQLWPLYVVVVLLVVDRYCRAKIVPAPS